MAKKLAPIHPGEILLEEFLKPMGVSQYRIAMAIGVPPRRSNEIAHRRRAITADTALRLSRYFGTSEAFWMNLQAHYDLEGAEGSPRGSPRAGSYAIGESGIRSIRRLHRSIPGFSSHRVSFRRPSSGRS